MRSTSLTGQNRRVIPVLLGIFVAQLHPTNDLTLEWLMVE